MKKKICRMIAVVMCAAMLGSYIPANYVQASETAGDTTVQETEAQNAETQETDVQDTVEGETEIQDETDAAEETEIPKEPDAAEEADTANTGEMAETETLPEEEAAAETSANDMKDTSEIAINYFYVESPYLQSMEKQNIVVSMGKGDEEISEVRLEYADENGTAGSLALTEKKDELYLFSQVFEDTGSKNYEFTAVTYVYAEEIRTVVLEELGIKAGFVLNQKAEDAEIPEDVEANVVSIDEEDIESEQAESAISDAIETVDNTAQTMSNSRTRSGKSDDLVVVLDAGHGGDEAGAHANGLKEEVLTLKIAKYAQAELSKYSGVDVKMTRTTDKTLGLKERVDIAKSYGADVFVSIHLNSFNGAAYGAEVYYPSNGYRPDIGEEGEKLAQKIQDELTSLGLYDRGIKVKDDYPGYYPDGSRKDYYAVIRYSKEAGFPGLIVEHAFIDNSSDANKFLKTEAGLKKLGVADATGIAKAYGLSKKEDEGEKVSVPEGTYVLESALEAGKVATVSGNSMANKAAVELNGNARLSSQRFEITDAGNGYYKIAAEHSGKVLDVKDGSSQKGALIQQYSSNGTKAQKWYFKDAGNGYYYICSGLGTYLDVKSANTSNGTALQSWTYNGSNAQKWKVIKSDYQPVKEGTYIFGSAVNSEYVMDVESDSMSNGANVQIYKTDNSAAQRFEVDYVSNGYYKIVAEHSGKALDVSDASASNKANVQVWNSNGTDAQLWKFVPTGNGYYYIKSKLGTTIDLTSGKAVNGTNIQMYAMADTKAQKWQLKETEYKPVKDGKYVISSAKSDLYVMTEKGSNIQLGSYDNVDTQKFEVKYAGGGYYNITVGSSGKALDVSDASTNNKANLQVWNANGTNAQLWKFIPTGNGYYYIKSKLGTTIDLTSGKIEDGTNIQMYAMADTSAQKWKLDSDRVNESVRPLKDGTYKVQNASNTKVVLDVQSGSESNGGNIRLYNSNDTSAQRYELFYVGNGYYKIMTERSGKALDVRSGSKKAGTNVQQYGWNNVDAQLWKILSGGDGSYYIKSKVGTVMDINGSKAISGSNVQMDKLDGSSTQKWKFVEDALRPLKDGTYSFKSAGASKLVLDIEDGSTAAGALLQIHTANGTAAQKFTIEYLGEYYKITSEKSGKVLEYNAGGSVKGASIRQNEWTGADNQQWKFVARHGDYFIKSKEGTVFDITSGKISSDTKIQTWPINGTVAQRWIPVRE